MPTSCQRRAPPRIAAARDRQRGFALIILMAIVSVGLAYALVTGLAAWSMKLDRERRTDEALALAKEALIGRAAADANHPGSLPCPDTDDDGSAEILSGPGATCASHVGRLPWKTLGLPDLRDGSGERLWYALSTNFRDKQTAPVNIINSDTLGTLVVYAADGATERTPAGYRAVAVMFSSGAPLTGQIRDTVSAACAVTGSTIQRRLCANNYLDSGGTTTTRNNAAQSGPYVAASPSDTFNDKLLLITTRDLMPPVERRVAAELIKVLDGFRASRGNYPWADSNPTITGGADANEGLNKGKLPLTLSYDPGDDTAWGNLLNTIPWFAANNWYDVIFYAIARKESPDEDKCKTADPDHTCERDWLRVDGSDTRVLFFTVGTPGIQTRPAPGYLAYLDDAANHHNDSDGDGCVGTGAPPCVKDDDFISPTSALMDRDRLYYIRRGTSTWLIR